MKKINTPIKQLMCQIDENNKQINNIFSLVQFKERMHIFNVTQDYIEKNISSDKQKNITFKVDDALINKNEEEIICCDLSLLYDKQKNNFILRIYDKEMTNKGSNIYEDNNDVDIIYITAI